MYLIQLKGLQQYWLFDDVTVSSCLDWCLTVYLPWRPCFGCGYSHCWLLVIPSVTTLCSSLVLLMFVVCCVLCVVCCVLCVVGRLLSRSLLHSVVCYLLSRSLVQGVVCYLLSCSLMHGVVCCLLSCSLLHGVVCCLLSYSLVLSDWLIGCLCYCSGVINCQNQLFAVYSQFMLTCNVTWSVSVGHLPRGLVLSANWSSSAAAPCHVQWECD